MIDKQQLQKCLETEIFHTHQAISAQSTSYDRNFHKGALCAFRIVQNIIEKTEVRNTAAHNHVREMYDVWKNLDMPPIYSPETVANIIADVALVLGVSIPGIDPDAPENQFVGAEMKLSDLEGKEKSQ